MPKKTLEEKHKKQKQKIYRKILRGESLSITEVSKLLNKKTITIKSWEKKGLIPSYNKSDDWNNKPYKRRMYSTQDLYILINNIMNYDWERNCLDREEVQKILNYLKAVVDIDTTDREIKDNPFSAPDNYY